MFEKMIKEETNERTNYWVQFQMCQIRATIVNFAGVKFKLLRKLTSNTIKCCQRHDIIWPKKNILNRKIFRKNDRYA